MITDEQKERILEWIKFLLKEETAQYFSALKGREDIDSDLGYCCLGDACQLYLDSTNDQGFTWSNIDSRQFTLKNRSTGYYNSGTLPEKILNWYGLPSSQNPRIGDIKGLHALSCLNDSGIPKRIIGMLMYDYYFNGRNINYLIDSEYQGYNYLESNVKKVLEEKTSKLKEKLLS